MNYQGHVTYMGELNFHDYYQIFYRGWKIIVLCLLIVVAVVGVYTFTSNFVYKSTASVSIDTRNSTSRLRSIGTNQDYSTYDPERIVKNEVEFLKSRSLAMTLAGELLQRKQIDSVSQVPLQIIHADRDGKGPVLPLDVVVAKIQRDLAVTPSRDADVIEITAKSSSPEEAALLANLFVDAYYNSNVATSRLRTRSAREFLESQMKVKQVSLAESEVALKNFMERERIVSLDDESKKTIEILSRFQAARDEALIESESIGKQLVSFQDQLEQIEPQTARDIAAAGDKYIEQLQTEIAKQEVNRDVIIAANPTVASQQIYNQQLRETENQINSLREKLKEKTNDLLKTSMPDQSPGAQTGAFGFIRSLKEKIIDAQVKKQAVTSRIRILNEIIRQYEGQFNRIPSRSMKYAQLAREKSANEKVYMMVSEKYQEAFIAEQSEFGYINVLDRAQPSYAPVSPRILLNFLLSLFGGLVIGFGVVIVRELIDGRVRSPEDVKKFGITPLALVHNFDTVQEATESIMHHNGNGNGNGKAHIFGEGENGKLKRSLVVYYNPMSPIAESFRRLRTSIFFASSERPLKSILITSAEPSEGKTTIVANLALTFAQLGKKTLMVDGDLRRGALHTVVNAPKIPGLTDFLMEQARFESVVAKTSISDLSLVGSGSLSQNPAELMSTPMMHTFQKNAEKNFDAVIYDSSPLLLVTDTLVLSSVVDGVILVVQSGETRTAVLEKSIEMLHQVGANIIGVVVNRFDYRSTLHSYYKSYSYYSYDGPAEDGSGGRRMKKRKELKRA